MTAPVTFDPRTLLAESRLGVLATIKADGRPQMSPVTPFYDRPAGLIHVSMTAGRAKTVNLRRDPRATLEVTSPDGRPESLRAPGDTPDRGPRRGLRPVLRRWRSD